MKKTKNDLITVKLENGAYGYTFARKGSKKGIPVRMPKQMHDDFMAFEMVYVKFQEVFNGAADAWKNAMEKYNEGKKKTVSLSEKRRLAIQKEEKED